jgi:polar amino acid transport system substrate-binding protein
MIRALRTIALLCVLGASLAACAQPAAPAPTGAPPKPTAAPAAPSPTAAPTAAQGTTAPPGDDVTASLPPLSPMPQPGNMPPGTFMREIQDRGRLIAGVKDDVLLWGYMNPRTNQIEGFEVDLVREIARAIFGTADGRLELRPVTTAARIPALKEGTVDLVAATMTITAPRKEEIYFSEVYYNAGQRLLVRRDSTATGIQDMDGKRVCATKGSTSERNIRQVNPRAEVVEADKWTDCLLLLQQGRIDGISTDDAILSGLAEQDPNTKIVGPTFSSEPYGLGVAKNHPEFVRFVNGVLQEIKRNGRWAEIYNRWLSKLGPAPEPPPGTYVES